MNPSSENTPFPENDDSTEITHIRSLKELIDIVSGRGFNDQVPQEDAGLAETLPYPFLALVGQTEMKLALCLTLINPLIGGTLLIGPRGTGKTTAVRSLLDLLPQTERSACFYGCLPEDIQNGGLQAVCPDCAKKYAEGVPLTVKDRVKLIELPLNSRLEDVVGGIDERAVANDRLKLKRGILAHSDKNLLYIDEVNLLSDDIVDAILDASAMGSYTVRRGPITATYRARFSLIGSMNPEEGNLRAQIMDRFGLRIIIHGLDDPNQRLEAYQRVRAFRLNPHATIDQYQPETETAAAEIARARDILPKVTLSEQAARSGIQLIRKMKINSLRAEITLFETARAFSAADGREKVTLEDIRQVAPMALRLRRSNFIQQFITDQSKEEEEIIQYMDDPAIFD